MRVEGWEKIFSQYLESKKNQPFVWGENDCILFAAKGYEAITGENYYSKYLPYNTEEEARSILKKNSGFEGIIGKNIGIPHKNILKAKRGDPVIMRIPNLTCGLVDDSGQYIAAPGEKGLVRYPLTSAYMIWSN